MKDMLIGLLSSKKAMVMLLTIVAMLVAKLGWEVEGEQLYVFLAPVLTYLLALGWTDRGKESAKILAAAAGDAEDPE